MKTRIEIYQAKNREWAWRAKRGAKIVADGSETYKRRAGLLKSLRAFLKSIVTGQIEITGDKNGIRKLQLPPF